jgi:hypothetical protein
VAITTVAAPKVEASVVGAVVGPEGDNTGGETNSSSLVRTTKVATRRALLASSCAWRSAVAGGTGPVGEDSWATARSERPSAATDATIRIIPTLCFIVFGSFLSLGALRESLGFLYSKSEKKSLAGAKASMISPSAGCLKPVDDSRNKG